LPEVRDCMLKRKGGRKRERKREGKKMNECACV